MNANGVGTGIRRRSRAEVERLVSEYKQSGLGRKEFSAAHGLSVHTLDAWRRRVVESRQEIVPIEIVENRAERQGLKRVGSIKPSAQFRIVLAAGIRIEIEPGFDAAELRRLIAALDGVELRDGLRRLV
jgi:transposase-like protein